jgi:hypothetical protein
MLPAAEEGTRNVPQLIFGERKSSTGFAVTIFRSVRKDDPEDVDTAPANVAKYILDLEFLRNFAGIEDCNDRVTKGLRQDRCAVARVADARIRH